MVGWMAWGMTAAAQQQGYRKGPWTPEEDKLLADYVSQNGEGRWSSVSRSAGLNRSGKSCRLRWVNYLRPGLKRCQLTPQEEGIIIELHALWGNKWSTIARYLPGRTDNEIKNYWRTHFKKRDRLTSRKTKSRKIQNQKQVHQPKEIMLPPQQKPQQGEAEPLGETKLNTTKVDEDNKVIITANYVDMDDCHLGRFMSYPTNEDVTNQDDFLWSGSLWSFNDPQGARNTTLQHEPETQEQLCSKVTNLQNQATLNDFNGFSWGSGDYANYYTLLYNEGYSFLLS